MHLSSPPGLCLQPTPPLIAQLARPPQPATIRSHRLSPPSTSSNLAQRSPLSICPSQLGWPKTGRPKSSKRQSAVLTMGNSLPRLLLQANRRSSQRVTEKSSRARSATRSRVTRAAINLVASPRTREPTHRSFPDGEEARHPGHPCRGLYLDRTCRAHYVYVVLQAGIHNWDGTTTSFISIYVCARWFYQAPACSSYSLPNGWNFETENMYLILTATKKIEMPSLWSYSNHRAGSTSRLLRLGATGSRRSTCNWVVKTDGR